ncbi:MAG: MipA/OmpV family protein [Mariprofundus sp.]|nr:MipA/OmpV family protein [Mariprofundus sp.]
MSPITAQADSTSNALPKWELGLALGAASLPQYMGSNERYNFAAPLPYFIYRGDRISMDRGGLRAALFDMDQLSLDLSLGAGLPVRNSNRARAGMPSLKFNIQAGPRLNWKVYQNSQSMLNVRLPVRGVIDTSGSFLGWLSEPDIQLQYKASPALKFEFTTGLLFASRKYHATFYDVAPAFVTPTRPAYQSGAGLHSASITARLRYQYSDNILLFTALRYRNLTPGTISHSPLVKSRHYISITVGMAWSIFQSEAVSRTSSDD